jgi:AcrR family transcriptional regulator
VRTADRILDAAMGSFATRGYDATALDTVASSLGVTRQAVLYWFPSKEVLFDAVVLRGADELAGVLEQALRRGGPGWPRVEAVVRAVFRLAVQRPQLLGLLREVSRLGSPGASAFTDRMAPLVERARGFLEAEMSAGRMRRQDPSLLLLSAYSAVVGTATEVEVMRALGVEPSLRSATRRRRELLAFLRSALLAEVPGRTTPSAA